MILTENNVYEMLMDLKDILNAVQNIAEQYYQENKKLEQKVQEYGQQIDQLQEEYNNSLNEEKNKYERLEQEYYEDKKQMRDIDIQLALLADTRKQLDKRNEELIAKDKELKGREDTYESNFAEYKQARKQLNRDKEILNGKRACRRKQ